jgi:tRNA A-37 threonylcarbamoyl transferase component Bud32
MSAAPWVETTTLAALRADELTRPDIVLRFGRYLYRSTGRKLGQGGMGVVYDMERRLDGSGPTEQVVAKTFHANYLFQLRTDDVTRRDHQTNLQATARIATIEHSAILPVYVAAPIADNYLFVTPRLSMTLLEAISKQNLTPRARVILLMQALSGLSRLHAERVLHRDFTLRNVLLDDDATHALLFDFDLAVCLDDVGATTYKQYYRGRIFGSPGYSVPPELIDPGLAESPIATSLDVFAVGGALFALFTDQTPYGQTEDMWGLLARIGDGVVVGGRSRINHPDAVPPILRPIIERCLERDPGGRYASVDDLLEALHDALPHLDDATRGEATFVRSRSTNLPAEDPGAHLEQVLARRRDITIGRAVIDHAEQAVSTWGYRVEESLGRVKGHPIFVAAPRPELLASGQFPDNNTFPKLVTVINLHAIANPRQLVENWQQYFLPTLKKVRQGLLTTLHKVIYDANTASLLLFSEFIDDARFGSQLANADLHLDAALALGFLVVRQVALLHENGMAHNNVHPGALLFKGDRESRLVQPAMIGLVEPALGAQAMATDVRALSSMVMGWIRPLRVQAMPQRTRPHLEELRRALTGYAYDASVSPPTIDVLIAALSDGLALVDFNFSVLRDSGGDLQEYALLLLSHRLFHVLWPEAS